MIFCKIYVIISIMISKGYGRLAQLVEHSLDVRRVRDSSSLSSTRGAVSAIAEAAFFYSQKVTGTNGLQGFSICRVVVVLYFLIVISCKIRAKITYTTLGHKYKNIGRLVI